MKIDQKPIVHVIFGPSAASSLRLALKQIGNDQRVIGLSDNLSYGPIDAPHLNERLQWIEHERIFNGYRKVLEKAELFWAEAISPEICPVAWITRRCASEYAGFLEFVWAISHNDFRVVDTTNIVVSNRHGSFAAKSLADLSPEQIIETELLNKQERLAADEINAYRSSWKRLREQNAALRVVTRKGLISAPITYFDDTISSYITHEWKKCARIIGETLCDQFEGPFAQTGDLILWTRLRALAETEMFEHTGDLSSMHHSEIRRARRQDI